jgi:poly [ADP-ribose] polymerase
MAPKRGAKAQPVGQATPLADCTVAVSGTFPGTSQAAIGQLISKLGGNYVKSVTQDCTHLVATPSELQRQTAKVKAALSYPSVHIVGLEWVQASEADSTRAPENDHLIGAPVPQTVVPQTTTNGKAVNNGVNGSTPAPQKTNGQSKRSASPDTLSTVPAKKQKTRSTTKPSASQSKRIFVPQDEGVNSPSHQVYVGPDGTIYDASLNQTNSSNNNNKFYRIQVGTTPLMSSLCMMTNHVLGSPSAFHRCGFHVDEMGQSG